MSLGSIIRTIGDYFYTETVPDTPTYGQRGVCKQPKRSDLLRGHQVIERSGSTCRWAILR